MPRARRPRRSWCHQWPLWTTGPCPPGRTTPAPERTRLRTRRCCPCGTGRSGCDPAHPAHRSPGKPHPFRTTAQSDVTNAHPPHTHKSTTPAAPSGHTPDARHHPADTGHRTARYPTRRQHPAQTTPDDPQATTPAYPPEAETADHDQPAETPSPPHHDPIRTNRKTQQALYRSEQAVHRTPTAPGSHRMNGANGPFVSSMSLLRFRRKRLNRSTKSVSIAAVCPPVAISAVIDRSRSVVGVILQQAPIEVNRPFTAHRLARQNRTTPAVTPAPAPRGISQQGPS